MHPAVVVAGLVDLVLPRRCVGCGDAGVALCLTCARIDPRRLTVAALPVHAATSYRGAVRAAVIAYKEHGRADLRRPLAALLAESMRTVVAASVAGPDARVSVVAIPSSRVAVRRRGEDVVRRLARAAAGRAAEAGGAHSRVDRALRLVRPVLDSSGLSVAARSANLAGAMAARPGAGRQVIVVDDVCTTGASIAEAARALRAAGWLVRGAAVVAATPHPAGDAGTASTGASALWSGEADPSTVRLT